MFLTGDSIPILCSVPLFGVGGWEPWDTWIIILGAVAAMSCTPPGVWLILRQQSMMGDALSHTALPGVVITFLVAQWSVTMGWITPETMSGIEPLLLALGAIGIGVVTALVTEAIQRLGCIEANAALGVVFTTLFALGLLLLRLFADNVHIDPDCVLFGQLELAVWNTTSIGGFDVPVAVLSNLVVLLINLFLTVLFYKELRLAAFDPEQAASLGFRPSLINYALMAMTAVTVVMAFTSVGSILVVAILIVPAACGWLCCQRLSNMIIVSLLVAAGSAVLGHVLAKTVPSAMAAWVGLTHVQDASTPGMMAVACGIFFLVIYFLSPQHSVVIRWFGNLSLVSQMSSDDILATLYRFEETPERKPATPSNVRQATAWISGLMWNLTIWRLKRRGWIIAGETLTLTDQGRGRAVEVVRGHRLWESFLFKNFQLEETQLHESADQVEHYLNQDLRNQLEAELDSPRVDPHGKTIPPQ